MRGILSTAGYVPHWRLARTQIPALLGTGGGRGSRAVASHDEDTTTMGVAAARLALQSLPDAEVGAALWFSTATPAYLDKTNAAAVHQALRLAADVPAFDFGGALRSGTGALAASLTATGSQLLVAADQRDGLPTSADEAAGGDGAAALLVGEDTSDTPVLAQHLGGGSATDELMDRWRAPGDRRSRVWEERFGETRYLDLGTDAWNRALSATGIDAADVAVAVVTGMHQRAVRSLAGKLSLRDGVLADDLSATVGQTGAAHPLLVLSSVLEREAANATAAAATGKVIALVHLADGADVLLLRTTAALARWQPARTVASQVASGAELSYGKFLSWRGMLPVEPPRRPEPQRVSSPAAWRSEEWKYGFVGSRDRSTGAVHLPPARVSMEGGAVDDMEPVPMADKFGTVVTFTVDRMAYSPSPPVVFAVVDFDGGGRFPIELTDVDADQLSIGDRVEMTFRRLYSADGIHDYFWKARPVPDRNGAAETADEGGS